MHFRPVIVDLKMGTQTWDEDCHPAKLAAHKYDFALCRRYGLLILNDGKLIFIDIHQRIQRN